MDAAAVAAAVVATAATATAPTTPEAEMDEARSTVLLVGLDADVDADAKQRLSLVASRCIFHPSPLHFLNKEHTHHAFLWARVLCTRSALLSAQASLKRHQ
jgi:hypothetical protein